MTRSIFARSRDLRGSVIQLLLIVLPGFVALLGVRPLAVPDEGRYPQIAREMMLSGDYITPTINGIVFLDKPALYYWLEALSFHLFGVSTWSVRLMPALFGVFGVAMVFITAYRLFSRRAAWWSAAVLASNPLYFLASQYADMNIEVAVLIATVLCLFLLGRAEVVGSARRRQLFWGAWLAIGLAVLTKGLIGLVLPALVVGAWTLAGRRWPELRHWYFGSGALIALAVCLPWFALVQRENPEFFHHFFIYQQFERFSGHGFNNEQPFWFYVPVVCAGLLPWSLWLPQALQRQWRAAAETGDDIAAVRRFLLLWPLLILVFFSIPASKIVGYILPALPPLALLIGDHLARHRDFPVGQSVGAARVRSRRERFLSLRFALSMPLLGALLCIAGIAAAAHFDRAGIRPLAAALQEQARPGDRIVSYRAYYQDLPLYLQSSRPLPVVDDWSDPAIMQDDNWRREFLIGLRSRPEAREWLLDEARFADLLTGPQRVFVLARARDAAELGRRYGLQVAARTDRNVLMIRTSASARSIRSSASNTSARSSSEGATASGSAASHARSRSRRRHRLNTRRWARVVR